MALTVLVRQQVIELRRRGVSYGQIAHRLELSRNTVKSICQRAQIQPESSAGLVSSCEQCGMALETIKNGRRFCSTACRLTWWHDHPERLNRKVIYVFVCLKCGKQFESYGKNIENTVRMRAMSVTGLPPRVGDDENYRHS
ncbi:helix-turn-helix domain-containing protein [Arcanobacterium phocae]|uniref:helix-turn-helix domain-containing protein n=1 Tax=Arcanobacterium phocae TaxID=131112 RepID=UPI001C0EEB25|nr:helix-turn-helix domain-containing protein [Arcanobacterium phocae]